MSRADAASPRVSVPLTARGANETPKPQPQSFASRAGEPQRTAPLSVIVGTLSSLQSALVPAAAAAFGTGIAGPGILIGLLVGVVIAGLGTVFSYIRWKRLTYTIGVQDIRVESGVLSRSARSVPYERIQDVSLEQKLLPRLLGLVAVKFETGAGGADDLSLTYLSETEGERLRELVRERRDDAESNARADAEASEPERSAEVEASENLFSMGPSRLFTYGVFEFSLAVFAVAAGLLQYLDSFFDIEVWDVDFWRDLAEEQGGWIFDLSAYGQALGAFAGLFLVVLIGSATGMFRTFSREWGFRLERTPRGFRRRRGLFTRTDVVMPVHRVQGLTIATRFIRYRFGWHSLRFVSLAQDAGSSSHVVAPFAKLTELDPIVAAAGFQRPNDNAEWHRATIAYRNVSILWDVSFFLLGALIAGIATAVYAPEWMGLAVAIPLALGAANAVVGFLSWRFKRHALDANQIVAVAGFLAPAMQVATRVKLHSVEIAQGPFARVFGYATLHLGMAGGEFAIPGIPAERAQEVRARILDTIAETDFSQLESQRLVQAA
ncbi:MAG: PH domain-containing protein [Erythrobacter sp.]|uniref:PH domain-containing protein n=1 Tax=Erythrobacter sp. TaxID=1042 RepID=UPI0026392D82|nr:PH domain-containing protein [Erythrobacter sp.]MDJ0979573.1 PH domain-containing protein [Erythrobacter sp.]